MDTTFNFKMKAPRFDNLLEWTRELPVLTDKNEKQALLQIYDKMKALPPDTEHDDYRHFWFCLERGRMSDFGSAAEAVREKRYDSREEFKQRWLGEYPDEKKWYHLETNEYRGVIYFYVDSNLTFQYQQEPPEEKPYRKISSRKLLAALDEIVAAYTPWVTAQNAEYKRFVNENLSYDRRLGKILRSEYWKINPEEKQRITKGLTAKDIAVLAKIAEQSADDAPEQCIEEMTAGKFFAFCRLGYDANGYFKTRPDTSNVEAYRIFADGRDGDLKEIDPDSPQAWMKWYDEGEWRCGGHPWEVCRGGTFTQISLFVDKSRTVKNAWRMSLGGSDSMRVNETVKFAIALYNNNVPFLLYQADEIYQMITGADYIGIVPQEHIPSHCHDLFPDEEYFLEYMNLDWDNKDRMIAAAEWYQVDIQ